MLSIIARAKVVHCSLATIKTGTAIMHVEFDKFFSSTSLGTVVV